VIGGIGSHQMRSLSCSVGDGRDREASPLVPFRDTSPAAAQTSVLIAAYIGGIRLATLHFLVVLVDRSGFKAPEQQANPFLHSVPAGGHHLPRCVNW
jgi:hypothetical protein